VKYKAVEAGSSNNNKTNNEHFETKKNTHSECKFLMPSH